MKTKPSNKRNPKTAPNRSHSYQKEHLCMPKTQATPDKNTRRPEAHDRPLRPRIPSSTPRTATPRPPGNLALPIILPSALNLLATATSNSTSFAIRSILLLTLTKIILVPSSSTPDSSHNLNLSRSRSVNR